MSFLNCNYQKPTNEKSSVHLNQIPRIKKGKLLILFGQFQAKMAKVIMAILMGTSQQRQSTRPVYFPTLGGSRIAH